MLSDANAGPPIRLVHFFEVRQEMTAASQPAATDSGRYAKQKQDQEDEQFAACEGKARARNHDRKKTSHRSSDDADAEGEQNVRCELAHFPLGRDECRSPKRYRREPVCAGPDIVVFEAKEFHGSPNAMLGSVRSGPPTVML